MKKAGLKNRRFASILIAALIFTGLIAGGLFSTDAFADPIIPDATFEEYVLTSYGHSVLYTSGTVNYSDSSGSGSAATSAGLTVTTSGSSENNPGILSMATITYFFDVIGPVAGVKVPLILTATGSTSATGEYAGDEAAIFTPQGSSTDYLQWTSCGLQRNRLSK